MKNDGWISLHRKIRDNWIWKDPVKLKWWMDILLQVNHDEKIVKVNIGLKNIDCGRGQSVMSLQNWAKRWNVSKGCARAYLGLLQKEKMIVMENVTKSTRITVCHFDSYNKPAHALKTHEKRIENALKTHGDPNNNDNNDNNVFMQPTYNAFYDSEIEKCNDENYLSFVKFLFGADDLGRPFTKLLKMNDQIDYKRFLKLKEVSEQTGLKIYEKCRLLENSTKIYSSLYLTLNNWLKNVR